MRRDDDEPARSPDWRHPIAAAAWSLLGACLLLAPGTAPEAATPRWTGFGASALWSDAANWDALRLPANGDDQVFTAAAQLDNVLDLTRTFASLTFAATAPAFALHVLEFTAAAVPEPGSAALWLAGLLVAAGWRRHRVTAPFRSRG